MKKQIIVEIDVVSGDISFHNPDEMNVFEILGALEFVKALVFQEISEEN